MNALHPATLLVCLMLPLLPGRLEALSASTFFPADNATGICTDTPLKITFDTAPAVGTSGAVRIHDSTGTVVETLDLAVPHTRTIGGTACNALPVIITGNTASIFPRSGVLACNTTYHVTIDASVFPGYAGISGSTAWRFTTKASAPSPDAAGITVAADGSGDFCTLQGAIDHIPADNTAKRRIEIRDGTYQEIVRIPSKHHLAFHGRNRERVIVSYPNNDRLNPGTHTRPLVNVAGNDVSFDNLTLHNTTPDGGSQAEALRVNAQRCVVNNCNLRSYQDTFLVNSAADTAFIANSLIEGDTDFIWGSGRVVFHNCGIRSLSNGYICQMRNPAGQCGAVFLDCHLTRAPGVTKVHLARIDPNRFPDSATAWVDCRMDTHILPVGWLLTAPGDGKRLRFQEYRSRDLAGSPIDMAARAPVSTRINARQAAELRILADTLGGWSPAIPLDPGGSTGPR